MAIEFVCSCGKHLRARDEMAARRSMCPRCGAPVGIPSLQATHRGAAQGPMSPLERQRIRQLARPIGVSSPAAARAAAPAEVVGPSSPSPRNCPPRNESSQRSSRRLLTSLVRQVASRGRRHQHWVETHWYHCLLLPRRAWPLVLGLAFVLTGFSGALALLLPGLLSDFRADSPGLLWLFLPCLAIPLLVLGYASGFLDWVLTAAMAGEIGHVRWPGRNISLALKSGARWLICFVAGPALPAGASLLYWIQGGELVLWDWMILAELNILALGSWFLLLLAVNQHDQLRAINPGRVVRMIHRVGHRLVAWAVFAAMVMLAHGWLASVALEKIHHDFARGWSLLFLSWTSGMLFATFLFRWVGVWFYWERMGREPAASTRLPFENRELG